MTWSLGIEGSIRYQAPQLLEPILDQDELGVPLIRFPEPEHYVTLET